LRVIVKRLIFSAISVFNSLVDKAFSRPNSVVRPRRRPRIQGIENENEDEDDDEDEEPRHGARAVRALPAPCSASFCSTKRKYDLEIGFLPLKIVSDFQKHSLADAQSSVCT